MTTLLRLTLLGLSYVFAVPAMICGEASERLRDFANRLDRRPFTDDEEEWPHPEPEWNPMRDK